MSYPSSIKMHQGYTKLYFYLFIIIIFSYYFLLIYSQSQFMIFSLWCFVFFLSLINPSLGLISWIIILPYDIYLVQYYGYSPYMGLTPALIFGFFVYNIVLKFNYHIRVKSILFVYLLIFVSFASWFLNNEPQMYRNIVSILLLVIVFLIISWEIELKSSSFWMFCIAVIAASLLSIIEAGISNWSWRIDLGGNVRVISNIYGLNMVLLAGSMLSKPKSNYFIPLKKAKIAALILFCLNGILLFYTVSRGVVLSVLISTSFMYLICCFWKNASINFNKKYYFWIAVSVMAIGAVGIHYFGSAGQQMLSRLLLSPLENIRISIWKETINQLEGFQWLVGAGLGTFRVLSPTNAYAHSVYVDTFVNLGIIGLIILLGFMIATTINLIKKRDVLGLGLMVFLAVSFSTHGSLSNKYFWLILALCYGLSIVKNGMSAE